MATGLDEIEHKLLGLLQDDDRVPVAELGKTLGVAPSILIVLSSPKETTRIEPPPLV